MNKLGIVLSGGGARGLAHAGLLQALQEQGIEFDYVAGTSAGALVGAFYAAGRDKDDMIEAFRSTPVFTFNHYTWVKPGLVDTMRLRNFLRRFFPDNRIEALPKQLFIATTNLNRGSWVAHHSGPLYRPLLASMSLPPYFSPIKINGDWHADGGIMNNFPVELLRNKCDVVIGSHVCPVTGVNEKDLRTTFSVWWRAYELNFYAPTQLKFDQCNYLFEPPEVRQIGTMDMRAALRAYHIGYQHAQKEMDKLMAAIHQPKQRTMPKIPAA